MANFVFSAELRGNAQQLKGELASTSAEAKKVTTAVREMGTAGNRADRDLDGLGAELRNLRRGLGTVGDALPGVKAGFDMRGPLQQLSQVSQQAMATGDIVGALSIQAADLGGYFGPAGIAIGVAAGALLPLAANALSAGEGIKSLQDELGELEGALGRLRDINDAFSLEGIRELRDLYGEVNAEVLLLTERQRQAAMGETVREATEAVAALKAELSGGLFQSAGRDIAETFSVEGFTDFRAYGAEAVEAAAKVREIQAAIEAVGQAEGFDAQADAVSVLLGYMEEAGLQATVVYQRLAEAESALRQVNAEGAGLQGWLGVAVSGASSFAAAMWDAASAALAASQAEAAAPMRPRARPDDIDFGYTPPEPSVRPRARPNDIDFGYTPPQLRRGPSSGGGSGGRSAAASAAEREAEAVGKVLDRLREEGELLRATDPVQQEMIRLRGELAGATSAQRAEVEALVRANLAEEAALEQVQARMEEVRELGRDVLGGIIGDLREGASAGEVLGGVIDTIADKLADLAVENLTAGLFGAEGSGGLLGSLLGGLGGGGSLGAGAPSSYGITIPPALFGGARATGGPVWPGQAFKVGERGEEIFVPPGPGTIIPNHMLRPQSAGGSSGGGGPQKVSVDVRVGIDSRTGNLTAHVASVAGALVQASEARQTDSLPDRIKAVMRDPRRR